MTRRNKLITLLVAFLLFIVLAELKTNQKVTGGYSGLIAVSSLFGFISAVLKSETGAPANQFVGAMGKEGFLAEIKKVASAGSNLFRFKSSETFLITKTN